MKPGDNVIIFANPVKCTAPVGRAELRKFILERGDLELWMVEYEDQPEHLYEALIKKSENGTGKKE
jgi:hypothetical protein